MNESIKPNQTRRLAGRCRCGAVQYTVADAFKYAANCHCAECRQQTGSAFKPFAGIERDALKLNDPGDARLIFGDKSANHDVHCGRCGSLLFSDVGANLHVTLGTLVDAPTIRPTAHIFVAEKAPWFEIRDDLPQYAGHVS
ncbi:MAG: GFA family protein [Opitutus sp.]